MRSAPLMGCIADDLTGGVDLSGTLVRAGLTVTQVIGLPTRPAPDADALVISLKSRSTDSRAAVADSLAALEWLRAAGCRRFYFKYGSTFDSTAEGNIGPVADALLDALGESVTVVCPAFPANGRTVLGAELFVDGTRLEDSPMRDHPLNPMTDSDLTRLLGRQVDALVASVAREVVLRGPGPVTEAITRAHADGARFVVIDAVTDEDIATVGIACADLMLATGASPLAGEIARAMGDAVPTARRVGRGWPSAGGYGAVIAGSRSTATIAQVAAMREAAAAWAISSEDVATGRDVVGPALSWALSEMPRGPVLIYSTLDDPAARSVARAEDVERAMGAIAVGLAEHGVGRLVVAGGETSGAVVQALGIESLEIGTEIEPGIPLSRGTTGDGRTIDLVLKSGNFGSDDFFMVALEALRG